MKIVSGNVAMLVSCLALGVAACAPTTTTGPALSSAQSSAVEPDAGVATELANVDFKDVSISGCCSMDVPATAEERSLGTPIDSIALRRYEFGASVISADLTGRNGLPPLAGTSYTRDQRVDGVDGMVNSMVVPAKVEGRDAVLTVTVICPVARCDLADRVFDSVEVM